MATFMMRRTVYEALTRAQQGRLRGLNPALLLGEPAIYSDGTNEWCIWDDWRYTLDHVAMLGAHARQPAAANPSRVDPKDITYSENGNPRQETLDAQTAPATVRMGSGVPTGWKPVEALEV